MVIGWLVRAHTRHLLDEVAWLREELRHERDRNDRLAEQFLSLKIGAPVSATAPSVPRETDVVRERDVLTRTGRDLDAMHIGELPG